MSEALRKTERLILTPPREKDAAALCDYATRNRDHLAPWSPVRSRDTEAVSYWREWIENTEIVRDRGVGFIFLIWRDEQLIGEAALTEIVRGYFQACYLGFSIDGAHQGQGLMREALRSVIDFAFDEMKLHRIMANHLPENRRSAATLAALGFQVEGVAKAYLKIGGVWRDHVLTALVNPAAA